MLARRARMFVHGSVLGSRSPTDPRHLPAGSKLSNHHCYSAPSKGAIGERWSRENIEHENQRLTRVGRKYDSFDLMDFSAAHHEHHDDGCAACSFAFDTRSLHLEPTGILRNHRPIPNGRRAGFGINEKNEKPAIHRSRYYSRLQLSRIADAGCLAARIASSSSVLMASSSVAVEVVAVSLSHFPDPCLLRSSLSKGYQTTPPLLITPLTLLLLLV